MERSYVLAGIAGLLAELGWDARSEALSQRAEIESGSGEFPDLKLARAMSEASAGSFARADSMTNTITSPIFRATAKSSCAAVAFRHGYADNAAMLFDGAEQVLSLIYMTLL